MRVGRDSLRTGSVFIACLWVFFRAAPAGAQLIEKVDYSDTFTVAAHGGKPERADGSFNTGRPAYDLEDSHGNPATTWNPFNFFSFNTGLGTACCGYNTNDGNDGAATGLAQSGGGDFSFAYGLRTSYIVELDAILPLDRLDVSSLPGPGAGIFSSPSLSVFFRRDSVAGTPHPAFPDTGIPGIGVFNGAVETAVTDEAGFMVLTGIVDDRWHNFAVHFDQGLDALGLYVDEDLIITLDLTTFAGGIYRGYSNAAIGAGGSGYDFVTKVLWIDNFQVGSPPVLIDACFSASRTVGAPPLTVDLNASCSTFANIPESYVWDFGDGVSADAVEIQHVYPVGGSYQVTLAVRDTLGNTARTSKTITVYEAQVDYQELFERPDGPVDGWTPFAGAWNIAGGSLTTGPSNEERWVWAGSPPVLLPKTATIDFDFRFLSGGTVPGIGRHGGMVFCGNLPTHRYDPAFTGYFVDWIDRAEDRGLRLSRVDAGSLVELVRGAPGSPADPPLRWRLEMEGDHIRLFGDDQIYIDQVDATYRGGLFGFWTWTGGQEVSIDNVDVDGQPLSACFTMSSAFPLRGDPLDLDASCSETFAGGSIESYSWQFGDGATDTGLVVPHAYAAPGDYTITLTVRNAAGDLSSIDRAITVHEPLLPFRDCFQRAAGPVEGWTPHAGEWTVTDDETLKTATAGQEHWVWAGAPARPTPRTFTARFDIEFLSAPGDGVGRHGGAVFCATLPTHRFDPAFSGYFVDWIDRAGDRGLRFTRVDSGRLVELVLGQGANAPADPPVRWDLIVGDQDILLLGDGQPYLSVPDTTYRGGYFGFWAYSNGQDLRIDNVSLPPTGPVPCNLSISCSITGGGNPVLHVEGTTGNPLDLCPPAESCDCRRLEVFFDGVSSGIIPAPPGLRTDIPLSLLPGSCPVPGMTVELGARCVDGDGRTGATGTCMLTCPGPAGGNQLPMDCNQDKLRDVSDAVCLLGYLFLGNPVELPCGDKTRLDPGNKKLLDHNGDGGIDISDAVAVLTYLFLGGPAPATGEACLPIAGCPQGCGP